MIVHHEFVQLLGEDSDQEPRRVTRPVSAPSSTGTVVERTAAVPLLPEAVA